MAMIETWVKCELKKAVQVQYLQGNLFSLDNQGNLVGVEVFDEGEPASLSGTVSANVIRADGGTVAVSGTLSGNKCYVVLPQAAYQVPGVVTIVIKLTASSVVTTLAAVVTTVYRSSTEAAVDPGTIISDINTLIAEIEAAVATIPADYSSLWATVAPAYTNVTFPVKKGQYCTYNGHMYRAKQDISSSESFTSSHWEVCNIGTELFNQIGADTQAISDLKSALNFNKTATPGYLLRATGTGNGSEWSPVGLPTDEQTAEAVSAWLDEHPEATTTVQDGAITKVKLNASLKNELFFEPVNVLSLGVKNDGTEDISAIVNEATQTHALFFPAGKYRIDNELQIVHSIYGVGYNRRFNEDDSFTEFICNIGGASTDAVIRVVGYGDGTNKHYGIDIVNIDIHIIGDKSGIIIETEDQEAIMIQNVGIKDIGNAYGIWVKPTKSTSRILFIDNCTIYGSYEYVNSVGILFDAKTGDCRLTNTEIMGIQKGVWLKNSILYMSDCHIWCGCRAEQDNGTWWANTVAIDCSTDLTSSVCLIGSNVYLDSAYNMIKTWRGNGIVLSNLICWMDGSMIGSSSYDGYLVSTRGEIVDKTVYIDGLVGYFKDRIKYVFSEASDIQNARLVYDSGDDFDNSNKFRHFPTTKFCNISRFKFVDHHVATNIFEIARAHIPNGNWITFKITSYGTEYTIYARNNNGTAYVAFDKKQGGDLYYEFTNGMLYIYYKRLTSSDALYYELYAESSTDNAGLLIYPYIRAFIRNEKDSLTGLTKITDELNTVESFSNLTPTQFGELYGKMRLGIPVLVSLTGDATKVLTGNRKSLLSKGYAMIVGTNVIDFDVMIGVEHFMIRTNELGVPSKIYQVNTTGILT